MHECKEYSYVYFKYRTSCLLRVIGKSTERAFRCPPSIAPMTLVQLKEGIRQNT